jgi:hypothetical protein
MTPLAVSVAYVLIWRLCVLACGLVCVILGYRLFQSGRSAGASMSRGSTTSMS